MGLTFVLHTLEAAHDKSRSHFLRLQHVVLTKFLSSETLFSRTLALNDPIFIFAETL